VTLTADRVRKWADHGRALSPEVSSQPAANFEREKPEEKLTPWVKKTALICFVLLLSWSIWEGAVKLGAIMFGETIEAVVIDKKTRHSSDRIVRTIQVAYVVPGKNGGPEYYEGHFAVTIDEYGTLAKGSKISLRYLPLFPRIVARDYGNWGRSQLIN
jgi:hypothetical protein